MTDEKLDQILKQALTPEIDDSEIQIRRKGRDNQMKMRKRITGGLAACAALALVVTGGYFGLHSKIGSEGTVAVDNVQKAVAENFFAITAYAAELPEGISSGDVLGFRSIEAGYGSSDYLSGRFTISGQNIDKVKVSVDKCEVYTALPVYSGDPDFEAAQKAQNEDGNGQEEYIPIYEGDPEEDRTVAYYDHLEIAGATYEGDYNDQLSFGMSVPKELWNTGDDPKEAYHADVDQVDGAVITIDVTFTDGSTETHHYSLSTGKIYVPVSDNGELEWDNLTRFLTADEETSGETPYSYGYLMERMD